MNARAILPIILLLPALTAVPARAQAQDEATRELTVMVGKSVVIDSATVIQRVSIAADIADAVVVNPREVMINGKTPGTTSLVLWQEGQGRVFFNLNVRQDLEPTIRGLRETFGDQVQMSFENNTMFLRGTVPSAQDSERAQAIAATAGKVVNLLKVEAPPAPAEPQIMLKVRFADVDRAAVTELGINLVSAGALNTSGAISTGQFGGSGPRSVGGTGSGSQPFALQDLLNIFAFRPDLNIAATIRALQQKRLLQLLAEPTLLTINNKEASFLAGGEFPFPVVQGGAAAGAVTIQFREFGVRLNFLPTVTSRNTIRLRVRPEVSSLDFSNALSISGFTVPAMATRRMDTEIELADGQSFIIGGLLDNRVVESFSKIPGLGDIPILKNLFRSRSMNRQNTELMVLVTPELVQPFQEGQAPPPPKTDRPYLAIPGQQPAQNPRAPKSPGEAGKR